MVESDRPQMTIWRLGIAIWITTATNTHSEYVLLVAFRQQQWLCERSCLLRLHVLACLAQLITATLIL